MNLKQLFLTKNDVFKANKKHEVKGIIVHSTGCNNPFLSRYIGPDDGLLGKNKYGNDWNQPRPAGLYVAVHAFIGKLKDGKIATYQTLPWDIKGSHSGSGASGLVGNGSNTGYIGFEICEDNLCDKKYFQAVYNEAVELCVFLCKKYKLDPMTQVICHSEAHKKGIASNHGDVMHWFPRHGKTMDMFRKDVLSKMGEVKPSPKTMVFKKGTRVRVKIGAKAYDGTQLHPRVYRTVYTVRDDTYTDRVVIVGSGVVVAAIKATDLMLG